MAVVNKINEVTADFRGMRVPVKVIVDLDTKTFEVEVGVPTTVALIIKELKAEKGAHQPGRESIGDISLESVVKIAITKKSDLRSHSLKGAVKQVLGTCVSMGVLVNGKNPKDVQREIDEGVYDDLLRKYEKEWVGGR